MESSLEAIRFLASSANRVAVLTALADGESTRRDLQEAVDGSRSTVARILDEAQERAWVGSEGSRYWLTPLGERMVADFRSYLETVEGVQHLGESINQFPPPLHEVDHRHLRDATVVEATPADPAAPVTKGYEVFREASEYRGMAHTAFPDFVKALRDGIECGRLDYEGVIEAAFVDVVRADPERVTAWESLVATTWVYDGTVPINLHVIDGQVLVWLGRHRGEIAGLLLSQNPALVEWATSLYETYRDDSEPLEAL